MPFGLLGARRARRPVAVRVSTGSHARRRRPPGPRGPSRDGSALEDGRLDSNTAFASRPRSGAGSLFRLRPTVIFVSFAIATAGYLINVPGKSPVDALPLAWTWFSLWLLLSAGAAVWERYLGPPRARRRRGSPDRLEPDEPSQHS